MNLVLGKSVTYKSKYDPTLLDPISRSIGRDAVGIKTLPFNGADIWNCYEVSWLNAKGKPEVRILELHVPATSPNIIESKSLKLYLNSFNNTHYKDDTEVFELMYSDISAACGAEVMVSLQALNGLQVQCKSMEGMCIDGIDVECNKYNIDATLLKLEDSGDIVTEVLYSDLLKANCLVTNQPDWASVQIRYTGHKINIASLLQYIISFRNNNEFAEQCTERIFVDIMKYLSPETLTVYTRFTRRGGIDINPWRSSEDSVEPMNTRTPRQ